MAAVSDATTAVGSSASWFKVAEMGMPSNNPDYWATEVLNVRYHPEKSYLVLILAYRTTVVISLSQFLKISNQETISSVLRSSVSICLSESLGS